MATMIEPRVQEILMLARREIQRTHFGDRMTPACADGRGVADARHRRTGEEVLDLPVRRGAPEPMGPGEVGDPRQATGLGLVRYAWLRDNDEHGLNGNGDGVFRGWPASAAGSVSSSEIGTERSFADMMISIVERVVTPR
jgi:cell division ATPase FtsA